MSGGLWNTLGCGCPQVPVLQTVDVGLGFVDFSSQRDGFQLGIFQPAQPADHVIAHIAQSPDQLIGLCGIPFTHRGIVSPAGALGTLNRAAPLESRAARSLRGYLRRWLAPAIRQWVDSPATETVG